MKQISYFHKGINTDLDYSKHGNDSLVLPSKYIRLINKEGEGLVVTIVDGNKQEFSISPNFEVIGSCEFNGILYIFSHNLTTGFGEIGSYPSPKDNNVGGFDNIYKPLKNLVISGQANNFRIKDVFDPSYPIADQAYAVTDYDGSVNLIFTDNHNPLRLVNSGFNQKGIRSDRTYNFDTVLNEIELIKSLPEGQKIEALSEEPGGQLMFGNYIFLYRYLTPSNDRTPFVAESRPYTVTNVSPTNPDLLTSNDDGIVSGKKIVLRLHNLDPTYRYVEIAYIRFSGSGNGVVTSDAKVIQRNIEINPDNQGGMNFHFTGLDTELPLDISVILQNVVRENVCRTITAYDRRIWGANWVAEPINYEALAEYALKIKPVADTSKVIQRWDRFRFYARPDNLKYVGYFRNEGYVFNVSFVLKSGYRTETFPVRGADARQFSAANSINAYTANGGANANNHGVFVFPTAAADNPFVNEGTSHNIRIMAVKFLMNEAYAYLNSNTDNANWIKENVSEIIFTRGERVKNLLYQGLASPVIGKKSALAHSDYSSSPPNCSIPTFDYKSADNTSYVIPVIRRRKYSNHSEHVFYSQPLEQTSQEKKIAAFFSTDFIFGPKDLLSENTQLAYLTRYKTISYNSQWTSATYRPWAYYRSRPQFANYAPLPDRIKEIQIVYNENNWVTAQNTSLLRLVNKASDGGEDNDDLNEIAWADPDSDGGISNIRNRNMLFPGYIGLRIESDFHSGHETMYMQTSIFRFNPNTHDYLSFYVGRQLPHSAISDTIPINTNNDIICFNGDCFAQSTMVKLRTWHPTSVWAKVGGADDQPVNSDIEAEGYWGGAAVPERKYAHGLLIEIPSENAVNTALRFENRGNNTYYPSYKNPTDITWIYRQRWGVFPYSTDVTGWGKNLGVGIESFLINKGNSATLSTRHLLSYNPFIPKGSDKYPNRIRYTGQQEPGMPILSYRMWDYMAKEDFDERNGEIVKLMIAFGRLLSIQESSILLHQTSTEEVIPTTRGEMIIGTRSILSKYPTALSRFGSQHILGVVLGRSALYGWDWINNTIWRVIMNEEGNVIARSMDRDEMIQKYVKDRKDAHVTDVSSVLEDKIFSFDNTGQQGIMVYYDKEYEDVLFYSVLPLPSQPRHETLVYNEKLNGFITTYEHAVRYVMSKRNSLYSLRFRSSNIFKENAGDPATFYGIEARPEFSFIVTGQVGRDSYAAIDKMFKAMEIVTPKDPLFINNVKCSTLFQEAENAPFIDNEKFWLMPKYLQSKWSFPLNVSKTEGEVFDEESNLNGVWLKVTIGLRKAKSFIRNIITIFTTSNT